MGQEATAGATQMTRVRIIIANNIKQNSVLFAITVSLLLHAHFRIWHGTMTLSL